MTGHAKGIAWGARSEEEVRRRRVALEKKELEAEQKHADLLVTQHANEKARLEAQVEREMATMRLAHIKAEQEFAARRAYYQVGSVMLVLMQKLHSGAFRTLHAHAWGRLNWLEPIFKGLLLSAKQIS